MKTLPKYFAIKAKESELFDKFIDWFNKEASSLWKKVRVARGHDYYWRDWSSDWNWYQFGDGSLCRWENTPNMLTLEEWGSIVNWTPKTASNNLTYETQYLRSDWTLFTKDSINWIAIETITTDMHIHISESNRLRGLLKAHKNKFSN